MTETTVNLLTIMCVNKDSIRFIDYISRDSYDPKEFNFSVGESIQDAIDISNYSKEEQLEIFEAFIRTYTDDFIDIKMVNATFTSKFEDVDIEDEYAEILQKNALEKLSTSEMKALGLMKRFAYIKLKYHNMVDEDGNHVKG